MSSRASDARGGGWGARRRHLLVVVAVAVLSPLAGLAGEVPTAAEESPPVGSADGSTSTTLASTTASSSGAVGAQAVPGLAAVWGAPGTVPGRFRQAAGIALAGDVYVADCGNDRVQRFTPDGVFVSMWGSEGTGPGQFDCPVDIARSGSSLLVLDQGNRRVQRFSLGGEFQAAWNAGTTSTGTATGIDTDAAGNVYVVDREPTFVGEPCWTDPFDQWVCTTYPPHDNNRVRKFSADGTPMGTFGGYSSQYLPEGVYVAGDGHIDVANTGRSNVLVRNSAGNLTNTVSLGGVNVDDVAEDSEGNLYVLDRSHDLVRSYTHTGTSLGTRSVPRPTSLAIDNLGRVYVLGHNRVYVFAGSGATGPPVWGRVTDSQTGAPVAGAWVVLLRASDLSFEVGGTVDASGIYSAWVGPGSYQVYVMDPSGSHRSDFRGGPPVTLTAGQIVQVDADMVSTTGSVEATVTDETTGEPIPGAITVVINGATGEPLRAAVADASGHAVVSGVSAGSHLVVQVDPTGAHQPEYQPGTPDVGQAVLVDVPAGGTVTADGALAPQVAEPGGATIEGSVWRGQNTGGGIVPNAVVVALRASDYRFVRAAVAPTGGYTLDVPPGDYKLAFLDPATGAMSWHDFQRYDALGTATTVTAPAFLHGSVRTPARGSISASVGSDAPGYESTAGTWVIVVDSTGRVIRGSTSPYVALPNLPVGTYRVGFVHPTSGFGVEFYNDQPGPATATPVIVTGGANTGLSVLLPA